MKTMPCPHCGSADTEADADAYEGVVAAKCNSCGTCGPYVRFKLTRHCTCCLPDHDPVEVNEAKADAIRAWNRLALATSNVWSRPMSNWKELVHDQSLEYCGPRFTRLTSKAAEEQSTDSKPPLHDIERVVTSFMEQMEKVIPFKGYFSSPLSVIEQDFTSIVAHMANLEVSLDEANNHIGDLEEQNSKLNEQIKNILASED